MPDITKIPAPRVPVLDPASGLMTREWYRFFYNLFVLVGGGASDVTIDDLLKGPPGDGALSELGVDLQAANLSDSGADALAQIADLQTQVQSAAVAPPDAVAAELEKQLQALSIERPDTVSAELEKQLQALSIEPRAELGTLSSINIDNVPYLGFDTAPPWIGSAAGQFWYDSATGAFNAKMGNNNITQQVGEEFYRYGKASAAISDTNLTAVYKTGTVGTSGVITFAPTVAGITRADQILGIATESLNINDFGRITTSGVVRGINTTGSVYGESWADNDDIWYNPITGGLTKNKPAAPNIKVMLGTVIKAGSGGSGSFFVNIGTSSELGGTDSNVEITSPTNGQVLTYVSANSRWENATPSAGDASSLQGYTWASPAAIGTTTPAAAKFTNVTATGYADIQGSTAQINVTWEGSTYTAAAALNSSNAAQFGLLGTSNTLNCYGITGYNSNTSGGAGAAGLGRYGVLGRALAGAANSNGVRGEAASTSGSIGVYGGGGASGTYGVWAYGGASGTALYVDGTMQITNTTLVTNLNADRLDGQHGSYYQPASTAITTSNIGSQSVSYANDAGYASSAGNADTLDGQHGSYYQPASTAITTSNIGSQSVSYASNAGALENKTWASPGTIGSTTATTGRFTRVTATGVNNVGLVLPIIASGQPLPALVTGGATYHIDYGLIICDGTNWYSVNATPGWVVI